MWSSTFLDESGRPSFNSLQNYASGRTSILYYVFDVLILSGQDLVSESLMSRREVLQNCVLSKLAEPIRESPTFDASLADLIRSVKAQGLEGLVAKRLDSRYEAGMRSGAWQKMRVNQGQEFVVGGYTPGAKNFDALIFGYYENDKLMYVGRTRNGFTPSSRASLFKQVRGLEIDECPFANPSGSQKWPVGAGAHSGENERVPMAEAGARWAVRISSMDPRRPPAARAFHGPSRR